MRRAAARIACALFSLASCYDLELNGIEHRCIGMEGYKYDDAKTTPKLLLATSLIAVPNPRRMRGVPPTHHRHTPHRRFVDSTLYLSGTPSEQQQPPFVEQKAPCVSLQQHPSFELKQQPPWELQKQPPVLLHMAPGWSSYLPLRASCESTLIASCAAYPRLGSDSEDGTDGGACWPGWRRFRGASSPAELELLLRGETALGPAVYGGGASRSSEMGMVCWWELREVDVVPGLGLVRRDGESGSDPIVAFCSRCGVKLCSSCGL